MAAKVSVRRGGVPQPMAAEQYTSLVAVEKKEGRPDPGHGDGIWPELARRSRSLDGEPGQQIDD